MEELVKNPGRISFVRDMMSQPNKIPFLLRIFPKPETETGERTTRHITHIVKRSVLQDLRLKAREVGATLNSCLVAVVNLAIVELAQSAGFHQSNYDISAYITTSLRRYIKKSPKQHIGPYGGALAFSSRVDDNTKKNFWKYCKTLQCELRQSLNSGLILEQEAVRALDHPNKPVEEYFTHPGSVTHEYCISNMGKFLGDVSYDNVKVTQIFVYNMIHKFLHSNVHQMIIHNGQWFYTMCYDTHHLSDEAANLFIDKIQTTMNDVTKIPVAKSSLQGL